MIYELRSYDVVPGRMPAMNARFKNHTMGLFGKHGIEVVGFWEVVVGTSNVLHYIVRFDDLGTASAPGRLSGAIPSGSASAPSPSKDGPIVARVRNEIWRPAPYSPMQ